MKHQTDYLVMLALPDRIENHIKQYKKACARHIGRFKSMYSQGHISFAIFRDEGDKPLALSNNMQQYFEAIGGVFDDMAQRDRAHRSSGPLNDAIGFGHVCFPLYYL